MKWLKIPVEDCLDKIASLADSERGRLFAALLNYAKTGDEDQELKGRERFVFPLLAYDCEKALRTRYSKRGAEHWNWKGGKTSENQIARNSKEYKEWRASVFSRDSFTCQVCGQVGGKLNAHHIRSFAKFENLRFDVSNGITLCERCHREVHRGA